MRGSEVFASSRVHSCVRDTGFSGLPSIWAITNESSSGRMPSLSCSSACASRWRFNSASTVDDSATVRARVIAAREKALLRAGQANAELSVVNLERDCALQTSDREWLEAALDKLGASARAYHRVLRVARTIADLEGGTGCVERVHLAEAMHYRRF